jgi:predicted nucleic acid-binding protein
MNAERVFLDTNVLVYAYSDDDAIKQYKARSVLFSHSCIISTQVLTEFSNIAFKKLYLPASEINGTISTLSSLCSVHVVDKITIQKAVEIKARYEYSFYDSLMVASAIECKCDFLYSEDMADGHVINAVMIKNIFLNKENEKRD